MNSGSFFATRGRACKFPAGQYGTSHTLFVTQPVEYEPQREKGQPLYWDRERTRPRMQAIISGYVTEGFTGPDDDGFRSIYVRGGIQRAIGIACRRAGVREPDFGMILELEYTHDGVQPDPDKRPPKEYRASLEVIPAPEASNDPRFFGRAQTADSDGKAISEETNPAGEADEDDDDVRPAHDHHRTDGARRATRGMVSRSTTH